MGFQHLSKKKRSETAAKAGRMQRSESLQKAWENAEQLKSDYANGKPPSVIAKEHSINVRAVYRIVRGK